MVSKYPMAGIQYYNMPVIRAYPGDGMDYIGGHSPKASGRYFPTLLTPRVLISWLHLIP